MQAGARGSAHAAAPCCSSSIQHRPVRAARRPARRVASQGDGSGDSGAQATGPAQPAAPASPGRTQKQQKAKPAAPRSAPRARAPPPKSAAAAVHDQVLLSVDYGTRHTGLALGHRGVCRQLEVLANDVANRGMFAREVLRVAVGHQAQGILVGIPLDPYDPTSTISNPNSDTQHGRRCRYFAHSLAMVAQPKGLQVYLYDESETSADARSVLGLTGPAGMGAGKDKGIDSLSAYLLLRKFYAAPGRAMRVVVRG